MSANRNEPIAMPDGGEMNLSVWLPEGGRGPGIVLIQEIFGVGPRLHAVAERLAAAGYVVGAPDVFWRFAPGWVADCDRQGLADSIEQVANLDFSKAIDDCGTALHALGALDEVDGTPAVLGFCLGGSLAFGVAARYEPSACVSYYGSVVPSMLDRLDRVSCPTLFHFGSQDEYIPGEGIEAVATAIAGRQNMVLNVEIAGHAFDNEAEIFYNEGAAKSAWSKTLAFLAEHVATG